MAEESTLGKSFLRGVGALAAALVLFAGEQFIQHHYWPDKTAPPSPGNDNHEPAARAMIPIAGRVVDAVGTKAIENAVVKLSVGEIHEDENTDTEGRYAFSLKGFDPQTAASMTIAAPGYKPLSMNLLLKMMADDKELKLVAEQQTAPVSPGIGAIVGATWVGAARHAGTPAATPTMVQYVRRANPKLIIAHN